MIKLLENLLTEATACPNVPGNLVAGLRKAVDEARAAMPSQTSAPPVVLDYDKLIQDLRTAPPPAADLLPQAAYCPPYRVCIKAHETCIGNTVPVGHVVTLEVGELLQQPACWVSGDKDGWVSGDLPFAIRRESKIGPEGTRVWRPLPDGATPERTGSEQPSAVDEMAEQMKRWAAPALAVQEGGSHYKSMKIQPVEYIHANGLGYFEGNVVKYVSRWRAKGGLQDLKKARHYLDLLIELEGDAK